MSTDRELLELAAKAYGIRDGEWWESIAEPPFPYACGIIYYLEGDPYQKFFNPIEDNDQALRLAVKTGLCITIADGKMLVHRYYAHNQGLDGASEPVSGLSDDLRLAAFRRAIVRAAAEIGRVEAQ
jgi:hypothetical protein